MIYYSRKERLRQPEISPVFCPQAACAPGNAVERKTTDRTHQNPLWAVCGANTALQQSEWSAPNRSADNTGLQQQIFRVEKQAGESNGVVNAPLRFTSDGNADRRTAWLRRFPEVCTVAVIRGCRCTCFELWRQKQGWWNGKSQKRRRFGQ